MNLVQIVIGVLIGGFTTALIMILLKKRSIPPLEVDGLLITEFTSASRLEDIHTQIEVSILANTDTMSKVKVLSIVFNSSEHDTTNVRKMIYKITDNKWINSNRIIFVTDQESKKRRETINNILKS